MVPLHPQHPKHLLTTHISTSHGTAWRRQFFVVTNEGPHRLSHQSFRNDKTKVAAKPCVRRYGICDVVEGAEQARSYVAAGVNFLIRIVGHYGLDALVCRFSCLFPMSACASWRCPEAGVSLDLSTGCLLAGDRHSGNLTSDGGQKRCCEPIKNGRAQAPDNRHHYRRPLASLHLSPSAWVRADRRARTAGRAASPQTASPPSERPELGRTAGSPPILAVRQSALAESP